jgi:hypothetical protein
VGSEETRSQSVGDKTPWDRPVIRPVGTIALLVRGGSAMGKLGGNCDGDNNNFLTKSGAPDCQ